MSSIKTIFSLFVLVGSFQLLMADSSRLLVSIDPDAAFSPLEFSKASTAALVEIESRNPYKAIEDLFLDMPFIVLSEHVDGIDPSWDAPILDYLSMEYGYRCVVFKEETLEEALVISQHLLENNPKYSSDLAQLTIDEATRLYHLLEKIDQILTSNQIGYWAGRETLLGAIRHGGLIPWDDYLHLFILDGDEAKLRAAEKDFEEAGLVLHSYFKDFYKICEVDGLLLTDRDDPSINLPFRYPAANIFIMTLEKRFESKDVYVHRSHNFNFNWNHERFDYYQLDNIHRVPFGPVSIAIPAFPEQYLDRLYGAQAQPDLWKTQALESIWDHRTEVSPSYSGATFVEIDNFDPAPWH